MPGTESVVNLKLIILLKPRDRKSFSRENAQEVGSKVNEIREERKKAYD